MPLDFWRQARTALDPLKPLFWLAETEDLLYLDVFDTCYAWRWMHQTGKYAKAQVNLQNLVDLLNLYLQQFPSGTCPLFLQPTMMRTAGMAPNTKNMMELPGHWPFLMLPGMEYRLFTADRNCPT
ncbi:hypothetical protein [Paraflavitalea speifideaquila]|uniref:hypothetical protein n=1 Tax=Paraflavitalea speifideaquila TaxID=3076558 RepID=UPI0028EA99A1|nr:hypothetical protein [Paraflavitalea speifideiaquila]